MSVAVIVKVSVPAAVGVPVMLSELLPVAGTTRPGMGFWILETAKPLLPVPPLAVSV